MALATPNMSVDQFSQAALNVGSMCSLASYLVSQSLISAAQGTVILNAFNNRFSGAAASLSDAAGETYVLMVSFWKAGTLPTQLLAFAADCKATFVESNPNDHPIGNWLAIIAALGTISPTG